MKWHYYLAEKLGQLPAHFQERLQQAMLLQEFSVAELERRKDVSMEIWRVMLPIIEREVQMSYEEIFKLV